MIIFLVFKHVVGNDDHANFKESHFNDQCFLQQEDKFKDDAYFQDKVVINVVVSDCLIDLEVLSV